MDTSETYIKMSDCPEIQSLRTVDTWEYGDAYTTVFRDLPYQGKLSWVCPINDAWADIPDYKKHRSECIWLPRQDDLQKRLYGTRNWNDTPNGWVESFASFCNPQYIGFPNVPEDVGMRQYSNYLTATDYIKQFTSMEQLWLAFYMSEKHNKVWGRIEQWENIR